MAQFPISDRNRVRRLPDRASYDQDAVFAVLDAALVAHLGYVVDGQPYVTPTCFWRVGTRLYWHGSVASRMIQAQVQGLPVCCTVTHLDGLVLARSAFNHSINYRSAMVFGTARALPAEAKAAALADFMERLSPGRQAQARPASPTELKQIEVMELDMDQAVVKIRTGGPHDFAEDLAQPVWAGVVPLAIQVGALLADGAQPAGVPEPEPWGAAQGQAFDRALSAVGRINKK